MTEPLHAAAHRLGASREAAQPLPERGEPRHAPRHLRVVEPRPSRLSQIPRGRLVFVVSSGLLLLVAFGLVYLHVVMAQRQIRLNELNAQVARAQSTYQNLELNVANLDAPQQIISTAEGKLGMRQPTSVTFLSPPADTPHASAATSGSALEPQGSGTSAEAPAGDANWPHVKAELAGSP